MVVWKEVHKRFLTTNVMSPKLNRMSFREYSIVLDAEIVLTAFTWASHLAVFLVTYYFASVRLLRDYRRDPSNDVCFAANNAIVLNFVASKCVTYLCVKLDILDIHQENFLTLVSIFIMS